MPSFEFTYRDEDDVSGWFQRARDSHLLRDAIDDIARELQRVAREEAPVGPARIGGGHRMGSLRRSIVRERHQGFARATGNEIEVVVFVDALRVPYAKYVHEGTGEAVGRGKITAGNIPSSAIDSRGRTVQGNLAIHKGGGVVVFRKSQKGQEANPFMTRAYNIVRTTYLNARLAQLKYEVGNL